jgi:CRISPR-associated protein Cas5h
MKSKLISLDFYSGFGFLKKPDINEDIYLTYNCLHKPALLGIIGAIIGLKGYYQAYEKNKDELPEYFKELNTIKVGIQPINSNNGNFQKTVITYNNSVGYASKEEGGNLIVKEQTLIKPSYRVYVLLDLEKEAEKKIYENLLNREAVFIPYLGKNDFQLYWKNFSEYSFKELNINASYSIATIFMKEKAIKEIRSKTKGLRINPLGEMPSFFSYFERLPVGFDDLTKNYELAEFTFTNFEFPLDYSVYDLFELKDEHDNIFIVQLF